MINFTSFSIKILAIASYYVRFLTQPGKISLFFLSPLSYAKISYILFSIVSSVTHAEIYKCVDDTEKITYQSEVCSDNAQSEVMTIKKPPKGVVQSKPRLKKIQNQDSYDEYQEYVDSETVKYLKKEKKKKCKMLKTRLKTAEKKVIDKCKRNREVFCDLPAIQIEKNERQKAIHQITNSYGGGTVTIPAYSHVEILQKEYEDNGCR